MWNIFGPPQAATAQNGHGAVDVENGHPPPAPPTRASPERFQPPRERTASFRIESAEGLERNFGRSDSPRHRSKLPPRDRTHEERHAADPWVALRKLFPIVQWLPK